MYLKSPNPTGVTQIIGVMVHHISRDCLPPTKGEFPIKFWLKSGTHVIPVSSSQCVYELAQIPFLHHTKQSQEMVSDMQC
jgi:hypothetical protein